jgi:hypothetical protein
MYSRIGYSFKQGILDVGADLDLSFVTYLIIGAS